MNSNNNASENCVKNKDQSHSSKRLTPIFSKYLQAIILCMALLPIIILNCSRTLLKAEMSQEYLSITLAGILFAVVLHFLFKRLINHFLPDIEESSEKEAKFLDEFPQRWVPWAIFLSAAASLALELSVIRWQGAVWEIFAFYKNFTLLACFAGLGLGYALAGHKQIPAILFMPVLALQIFYLIFLRNAFDSLWLISIVTPVMEQLNMGFSTASHPAQLVATYCFLITVMLLTVFPFIPVGQVCGRLLERMPPLKAYGFNLLGSVAGVALTMALGYFWTPPLIWLLPCIMVFIWLQSYSVKNTMIATAFAAIISLTLVWPTSFGYEKIYSPYQLLERGASHNGLMMIRAAGHYYQRVHDLSEGAVKAYPEKKWIAQYYEIPYTLPTALDQVAVVGAGTGNDVAAGLRRGAGHVDAIEIDPAILALGKRYHPENPYNDPRVSSIAEDARSFLRTTKKQYDLIVYGLLDSHTLLSHASSVRLDSFVYTIEGFKDARARLKENGVMSLSFCILSPKIGRKIYLMMEEAFDGNPPICVRANYDGSVTYAQAKNGGLKFSDELFKTTQFTDNTKKYADPALKADPSTDEWPFFYMPERIYPVSYLWMILLISAVSLVLFLSFSIERPRKSLLPFFFMGSGFMLVETKAITELGLVLGNTWQVIGVVISAILMMAFLANFAVMKFGIKKPAFSFAMIIAALGVGLAMSNGYSSDISGKLLAIVILTLPMFFAGIAFSTMVSQSISLSGALSVNLFGSMCGGLLEYNSMYFGFNALYWMAMAFYLLAMITNHIFAEKKHG